MAKDEEGREEMSEDCHECCGDNPTPDREDVHAPHPAGDVVAVPATIDVREIVDAYLVTNGYDCLWNKDDECACEVGDLAPCGEDFSHCIAGRRKACDCGEHDWHIVSGETR